MPEDTTPSDDPRESPTTTKPADSSPVARAMQTVFWASGRSRLRAGWRILGAGLVLIGTIIGLGRVLDALALPHALSEGSEFVVFAIGTGVMLVGASRYLDRRPIRDYGFRFGPRWWRDVAGGIAIGVGMHAIITGLHVGLGWAHLSDTLSTGAFDVPLLVALGIILLQFAGVALWEETLFRGVFILNTTEGLSGWSASRTVRVVGAWLLATLVFGGLHVLSAGGEGVSVGVVVTQAIIAGAYFGLPYVWTGSLALPIGMHLATNFADTALFGGTAPRYENFPTVFRMETTLPAGWESVGGVGLVVQLAMLGVVAAWVYGTRGRLSVAPVLLQAATPDEARAGAGADDGREAAPKIADRSG